MTEWNLLPHEEAKLLQTARDAALLAHADHAYLPNTPALAALFQPHEWVLEAMRRAYSMGRAARDNEGTETHTMNESAPPENGTALAGRDSSELLGAPPGYRILLDENDRLRAALTKLMQYAPRREWRGGIETGGYVPAGAALLAVLDECDAALAVNA